MNIYKDILVEIEDKCLDIKRPLRAYFDGDISKIAGNIVADRVTDEGLFVDIESEHDLSGYHPSVYYKVTKEDNDGKILEGQIYEISLSKFNPNIDERIRAIS